MLAGCHAQPRQPREAVGSSTIAELGDDAVAFPGSALICDESGLILEQECASLVWRLNLITADSYRIHGHWSSLEASNLAARENLIRIVSESAIDRELALVIISNALRSAVRARSAQDAQRRDSVPWNSVEEMRGWVEAKLRGIGFRRVVFQLATFSGFLRG
jgi:hypothetical protein